jgi:hypothetical protein
MAAAAVLGAALFATVLYDSGRLLTARQTLPPGSPRRAALPFRRSSRYCY